MFWLLHDMPEGVIHELPAVEIATVSANRQQH